MKTLGFLLLSASCLLLATDQGTAFQDKKKDEKKQANVYTDPKEAGPDYLIQGEYEGEITGKGKYGVQIVALGDGKFDVYFLAGGLPGKGWDTKTRTKISATRDKDNKTSLTGSKYSGEIANGKFTGKTPEGNDFTFQRIVRESPTLGAKPPEGAVVLFDGSNADLWKGGKLVEGNLLFCGTNSTKTFSTGTLHIEFRTPFQPKARGQGRGNSGVYVMGREVQVLDSFGLNGENNECGAFYGSAKPLVNMCFPPLTWQTYDIEVKPGEKAGELLATVKHNGVVVHDKYVIKGSADKPASINLQNHGNPVVYRNIWMVPLSSKP